MNPLPNIIVLDFCEWLNQKITNSQSSITFDLLINQEKSETLELYAEQFLLQKKRNYDCAMKSLIEQFITSKEFNRVVNKCKNKHFCRYDDFQNRDFDFYYCIIYCLGKTNIVNAFEEFIHRAKHEKNYYQTNNITAKQLVLTLQNSIKYNDDIVNTPQFTQLIFSSKNQIAEEINFLEWLQQNQKQPSSIFKMPTTMFESLVDDYVNSQQKGEIEKKQLLKSYKQTGFEALFKQFRTSPNRNSKDINEIISRYCSHYVKFNCVILPLSDKLSQEQYKKLLKKKWNDLNELSENYLDIFYSESDNGKSGFDIAKRINLLPEDMKKKAPCLIIWKQSIKFAQAIQIDELNCEQIFNLIRFIVNQILLNKELGEIVMEANKEVKRLQLLNHATTFVEGDYIVGDNNKITVTGDNNSILFENNKYDLGLIKDFDAAIQEINSSQELNDKLKLQICEIMEEAKVGISQKSSSKIENSKNKFNLVKAFFVKLAPNLFSVLANITQIASFFNIQPQ